MNLLSAADRNRQRIATDAKIVAFTDELRQVGIPTDGIKVERAKDDSSVEIEVPWGDLRITCKMRADVRRGYDHQRVALAVVIPSKKESEFELCDAESLGECLYKSHQRLVEAVPDITYLVAALTRALPVVESALGDRVIRDK